MNEIKCEYAIVKDYVQYCKKTNDHCGNQRYCAGKGRWLLTEAANNCPMKKAEAKAKKPAKRSKKNGQK